MKSQLLQGDCLSHLRTLPENSIDFCCTDPPYRYKFMNKAWDDQSDFTAIWKEVYRVLKPGGFCAIFNAPRQDCQLLLLNELAEANFILEFTPIYWTYASGFPKAMNMGKAFDKRAGKSRDLQVHPGREGRSYQTEPSVFSGDRKGDAIGNGTLQRYKEGEVQELHGSGFKRSYYDEPHPTVGPQTPEAEAAEGSYAGFQPKPAVEIIHIVMKPIEAPTYLDQFLQNQKGVTWMDDGRIPYAELQDVPSSNGKPCTPGDSGIYNWNSPEGQKLKKKLVGGRAKHDITAGSEGFGYKTQEFDAINPNLNGRFPANLLISDNVLDQGVIFKTGALKPWVSQNTSNIYADGKGLWKGKYMNYIRDATKGDFSRYFSLDAWWEQHKHRFPDEIQRTFPFLYCPKPTKKEKNKGLTTFETKQATDGCIRSNPETARKYQANFSPSKNFHPTVKPLQLLQYLITLFSRLKDIVLDPFAGSGTTCVAAKLEDRRYLGIEQNPEYYQIMRARVTAVRRQLKLTSFLED